jgi:hypothetical protein
MVLRRASFMREGESMADINSADSIKARLSAASKGVKANLTGKVTLGGVTYTPTTMAAVFDGAITAYGQVDGARVTLSTEVQAKNAAVKVALKLLRLFGQNIISTHGEDAPTVLGQYGIPAPKKRATKPAVKAAAAVKAVATREMRGTKGPKAKLAIKSNVQVATSIVDPSTSDGSPANGSSTPSSPPPGTTK